MAQEYDESHADNVRSFCLAQYIEPARRNGQLVVAIRVGDVHKALQFKNRLPLVCSALGATTFEERNRIRRIAIDGPLNGANTVFVFRIL